MPIRDCLDRDTQAFLDGRRVRAFEQCARAAIRALTKLQVVERLNERRNPPPDHFEALAGESGRYSIRIDRKLRVCLRWATLEEVPPGADVLLVPGEPYEVEITNHYD
jgi:proteic killer suppression protein